MRYQEISETDILDTESNLIWKKDPEPRIYSFDGAIAQASNVSRETGRPWRVPTVGELFGLLDHAKANPASMFPNMPPIWFWSSSPYAVNSSFAWRVSFYNGYVSYGGRRGNACAVRLVRGG